MRSRHEIEIQNSFLGRVCPAFCCVYSELFWADCFRVPGSDFSQRDYTILSWRLVLDKMIKKVFCRWTMGLNGATESIGFSIPERKHSLPLLAFLFSPVGGGVLCVANYTEPPPLSFFSSRYVHSYRQCRSPREKRGFARRE